jgi:acetone carboxylase gamma subunit
MLFEFPVVTETRKKVEAMKDEIEVLLANIEPLKSLGLEASEVISRVGGCYEALIKVAKEEDIEKWQVHIMRSARISVESLSNRDDSDITDKKIDFLGQNETRIAGELEQVKRVLKDAQEERNQYQSQASQLSKELDNFRAAASQMVQLQREKDLLQTTLNGLKGCLDDKTEENNQLHQQTKELLSLRKENSKLKAAIKRLNEQLGFKDNHELAHQEELEILEQHEKDFQAAIALKVGDFVETEEGWRCEVTYTLNENPRVVQILTPEGKKENRCVDNLKIIAVQEELDTYPAFPKLEKIAPAESSSVEAVEAVPDGVANIPAVENAPTTTTIEVGDIVEDKLKKIGTVIALLDEGRFANVQFVDSCLNRRLEHLTLIQKSDAVPVDNNQPPAEQEIINFLASIKTRKQMSAISWLKIKDFVKSDTDALQLLIDAADSDKRLIIKDFSAHVTKVFSEYVQGTGDSSDIEWSGLTVAEPVETPEEELAF